MKFDTSIKWVFQVGSFFFKVSNYSFWIGSGIEGIVQGFVGLIYVLI